jgi:hypothetical protein
VPEVFIAYQQLRHSVRTHELHLRLFMCACVCLWPYPSTMPKERR